jgi:hypothetical protein
VAAEQPLVTFGCGAAGGIGVGCDNGMDTDASELGCLLLGQGGAEWSDPDVASPAGEGYCVRCGSQGNKGSGGASSRCGQASMAGSIVAAKAGQPVYRFVHISARRPSQAGHSLSRE